MPAFGTAVALEQFTTFGDLLKYLRRRAGLTQRELSIAVGYSDTQISRLELNQRPPDLATKLLARRPRRAGHKSIELRRIFGKCVAAARHVDLAQRDFRSGA